MTSGLGRNLDSVVDELEKEYGISEDREEEKEAKYEPFDWTSETYQYMCREYRQSLGIVNQHNYESRYQTESERKYSENLYEVRGYGPYEGTTYVDGVKITKQVLPGPPNDWAMQWAKNRGMHFRDVENAENIAAPSAITLEQEAKAQEFLTRMKAVCIKDGTGEIIAITDGTLLSEFQVWLSGENLSVTDEMAQLIRDSWVRIFSEEQKVKEMAAPPIREMGGPEPLPSPIPPLEKPQKTVWADLNDSKPAEIPAPTQLTTGPKVPRPVWSNAKEGFVYV
jgi:hypothetical protein